LSETGLSETGSVWRSHERGVLLRVAATPKAAAARIGGCKPDAAGEAWLDVRVTAPPAEGEANAALIALVATALGVAPRDISLVGGAGSRRKTLAVRGDAGRLGPLLDRLAAAPEPSAGRRRRGTAS
jgi:hypothetical protein